MMLLGTLLLGLVAGALLLTSLTLLAEVIAAITAPLPDPVAPRAAAAPPPSTVVRPRTVVLIPAHNEATGITGTLLAIRPQLADGDRMLVVADNCSDDTAARARAAGAWVVERHDTQQRGKGYALAFGVSQLSAQPPDVVLIVDADCVLGDGALDTLVDQAMTTGRPAQACYLMAYPERAGGLGARIAEFAFIVKNRVRPHGSGRLGAACPLFGSGMAFPWSLIAEAPLANGNIVEDMKLGVDLAMAGQGARYCANARVDSFFPTTSEGQDSQRTRWEHGHLHTLRTEVPRLLAHGLRQLNPATLGLALDLAIPPLSLQVMLLGASLLASVSWLLIGGAAWPAGLALGGCVATVLAVLLAWHRYAREVLPAASLAAAPAYALRKLGIYRRFAVARQTTWVRSRRDRE